MLGASNIRLIALANGIAFPVSDLAGDRVALSGFPAGTNPFQPYQLGDLIPMTLVAEREGQCEVMPVEARLQDLFAGEAIFALPSGLAAPMPAPADLELPPVGSPAMVLEMPAATPEPPVVPVTPAYAAPAYGAPAYGAPAYADAFGSGPAYAAPAAAPVVNPYNDSASSYAHAHDSTEREELSRFNPVHDAPRPGMHMAPNTRPMGATPGPYAYGADMPAYTPGAPGVAPYVPGAYAPVAVNAGLATTPGLPAGQVTAVQELGEDDERSGGSFARGAGLVVVGAVVLLGVLVLMLAQRSGVQSVQAALRGQRVEVSAPSDGVLDRLSVSEGSAVRAGQPLFGMDNRLYQAEMQQLRLDADEQGQLVEGLQQSLETARKLVGSSEGAAASRPVLVGGSSPTTTVEPSSPARIEAAQARLTAAEVRQRETSGNLARAQRLFEGGAMTRGDFEAARADAQAADAEMAARAADLREAQTGRVRVSGGSAPRMVYRGGDSGGNRISAQLRVLDLERNLVEAQAAQRTAQMRLQQAQSRVSNGGMVVARSNGVVSSIERNAGASVRAGDQVLAIETTDNPYVVAYFPFREARLIRQGAVADVNFPATGTTMTGKVDALGSAAEGDARVRTSIRDDQQLTPVRIRLDRMPQGTTPGAQADVTVEVGLRTVLSGRLH